MNFVNGDETCMICGVVGPSWCEYQKHPPYSPDLAPSDFALFPALKQILERQHFQNDEELKNFTTQYFLFGRHILPHIDAKTRPALR